MLESKLIFSRPVTDYFKQSNLGIHWGSNQMFQTYFIVVREIKSCRLSLSPRGGLCVVGGPAPSWHGVASFNYIGVYYQACGIIGAWLWMKKISDRRNESQMTWEFSYLGIRTRRVYQPRHLSRLLDIWRRKCTRTMSGQECQPTPHQNLFQLYFSTDTLPATELKFFLFILLRVFKCSKYP